MCQACTTYYQKVFFSTQRLVLNKEHNLHHNVTLVNRTYLIVY